MNGYLKSGNLLNALNMFETMLKNKIKPNVITFNTLDGCRKLKNIEKAKEMLELMKKFKIRPNKFTLQIL